MAEHELSHTPDENQTIKPETPLLKKGDRQRMGVDLMQSIQASLSDRSNLDVNLDDWDNQYEMRIKPRDDPWPNASNVYVPLIPEQIDTMAARLAAVVFVPRLFNVNGNTKDAAQVQHEVERYYNTELMRPRRRTGNNWVEDMYQCLHLGLKDGTSVTEILWKQEKVKRKVAIFEPVTQDGEPVLNAETGKPEIDSRVEEIEITEYDDVELTPVSLRDFVVIPAWQTSIEEAAAVARKLYLDEATLRAMVKSGTLWEDAVEKALQYVAGGQSDLPGDSQGTVPYEAGGNINIGEEEGATNHELGKLRGPLQVWRVHTRQYDLDGDGVPEENVLWVHDRSDELLGHGAYEYWHGYRPFVDLSPWSRPGSFYGFSMAGRLRTLQAELNAIHNQRNDEINLRLSPPRLKRKGADIKRRNMAWGPDAEWEVEDIKMDYGIMELPDVPTSTWQEEQYLYNYAQKLTGLNNPASGQPNSGRRTAKEVSTMSASAGIRGDLMAARVRAWLRRVFFQIHQLKLQYGPDHQEVNTSISGIPEKLDIDKMKLSQDFTLSIAGEGGPLDKAGRQQEMFFLYGLLMQNPLVQPDKMRVYAVTRMLLEEYNRADVVDLIGTREEVQQRMQAEAQAAQQAAMMGQQPGQPPQGQGGQNGQQKPQNGQAQPPMPHPSAPHLPGMPRG